LIKILDYIFQMSWIQRWWLDWNKNA